MSKDKGTTLPITQLSGLMINYTNNNSTLNPPSMTTVQRNALVNTVANEVDPTLTIKEGTQIYNIDPTVQKVQIMQGGKWVNVGLGSIPPGFDTLVFNNAGELGKPAISVPTQIVTFNGTDGQSVVPAINNDGDPIKMGKLKLLVLNKNRSKNTGASKKGNLKALPTDITALQGIGALDFSEGDGLGFITCEEQQFITLNIEALGIGQNILLTDDQTSSDPDTYDAIVEIRSQTGGLLLPRLTSSALSAMSNPVAGLSAYNTDLNAQVIYDGTSFVPLGSGGGGIVGPTTTGVGVLPMWGNTTGTLLVNSGVSYSQGVFSSAGVDTSFLTVDRINLTTNSVNSVALAANLTSDNYTFTLPTNAGNDQQVLSTDGGGRTSWININIGNVTGPLSSTTNAIAIYGDDTGKNILNTGVTIDNNNGLYLPATESLNSIQIVPTDNGNSYIAVNALAINSSDTFNQAFLQSNSTSSTLKAVYNDSVNTSTALLATQGGGYAYLQLTPPNGNSFQLSANLGMTRYCNYVVPASLPSSDGQLLSSDTSGNMSWNNAYTLLPFVSSYGPAVDPFLGQGNVVTFSTPLVFSTTNQLHYTSNVTVGYLNPDTTGSSHDVSLSGFFDIITTNRISAAEFDAISSINVKDILKKDGIEDEVLELFNQISLVKYQYKDKIKEGNGHYYGIIAEELQKVIPHFVHNKSAYIPNIMCRGIVTYKDPQNIIISLEEDKQLDILMDKKIQLFTESGSILGTVTTNTDEIIHILLDKEVSKLDRVFVYGTYENCPAVAKERLFEMNMVVTQNLLKRIAILEQKLGA